MVKEQPEVGKSGVILPVPGPEPRAGVDQEGQGESD
jgi:hypothetical protein